MEEGINTRTKKLYFIKRREVDPSKQNSNNNLVYYKKIKNIMKMKIFEISK